MRRANWEYQMIIIITGVLYIAGALYVIGISLLPFLIAFTKGISGTGEVTEGVYELPAIFKYYLLFKIKYWWILCFLSIMESLLLIIVNIQFIRFRITGRIGMELFNCFYILKALWNVLLSIFAWKIMMQDIPLEGLDPVRTLGAHNAGLISSAICIGPWILLYLSVIILLRKKQVRQLFN